LNSDIKMKGGLNTARLLMEKMLSAYPSFDLNKVDSGSLDGASSNFSDKTGLKSWMDLICAQQKMIWTHCFAHRLSLDVKHSYLSIPYVCDTYQPAMLRLWVYISKSPVRKDELDTIQTELTQLGEVSITKASVERWLSNYPSAQNMRLSLRSLTIQVSRESSRIGKPHLRAEHDALVQRVCSFNFFATVYFMCDVLKPVHLLHARLQTRALVFSDITGFYLPCKAALERLASGLNEDTAPSLMGMLADVRNGRITTNELRDLRSVVQDSPEDLAQKVNRTR
jgi:hypothetical protein